MTQGSFLRHQALLVKQGLAGQISGLACIRRMSVWSGLCPHPGLSNLAAQLWLAGCLIEVIGLHLHAAFLPRDWANATGDNRAGDFAFGVQRETPQGGTSHCGAHKGTDTCPTGVNIRRKVARKQNSATVDSDHLACTGSVIRDNTGIEFGLGLYYHERGGKAVHASVPTWFERIIC